jgi:Tc toxin complex TcA C-terminal TcB-binding domain
MTFEFQTFYHPYSNQFVTNLNRGGIKELMGSDTLKNSNNGLVYNDNGSTFINNYYPTINSGMVTKAPNNQNYKPNEPYTYYKENICFDVFGTNSLYNWELFFHAPLYIATRLSKNGKYEEAMKWFHYIFDPTTNEESVAGEETSRYWKTLPFKTNQGKSLEEWFINLGSNGNSEVENAIIKKWRDNPFKPFAVARNRPVAFMKNVVLKYVENIRLWADSLFRAFTRETVNEALQLYVIANHILGPKPEFVPKRGTIKAETYNTLKDKLDDFSNALVEMENAFPFSSAVSVNNNTSGTPGLLGMGQSLYFCIPSNEKLIEHWDIIADRLFKIRHCMDIDGNERHLALFAPPIDPAMLINAAANELSLGSILSNLSSPPPIYRFTYLLQKANEFCNEVKSLGGNLLAAIEKKDSAKLERLRATHELNMLDLMTGIKERQILDAKVSKEGLLKSRETAAMRLEYYNSLLSTEATDVPPPPTIDADLNADSQLPADTNIAKKIPDVDVKLVESGEKGVKIIPRENEDLALSNDAINIANDASFMDFLAGYLKIIPQIEGDVKPVGVGAGSGFGGEQLGGMLSLMASAMHANSSISAMQAAAAQKMAGYIRREQDWTLQANLASREIIQLDKQIISADIKIQVSQKELANHKQQIENSKQVEQFLKDKFSNEELYQWMKEQLFAVYKESYNLAYDMANKAEKCYRFELGIELSNFITYGYWDNAMQGLCSGEKLQLSLRQLEKSYIEENKRDYEITKHISLNMLDPLALIKLRATGVCDFDIPEVLFDMDYAGQYFRRTKSVSISIPCIAGPYTSVSAKLSLLNNKYRKNKEKLDTYPEDIVNGDDRFVSVGSVQHIAASSAQNDSGVFELNFRDERYLPFEGTGTISRWRLELPTEIRQYDYNTIADVVMHIKYTAKDGDSSLKEAANNSLKESLANIKQQLTESGLHIAINMKHDMPNEWHMLTKKGKTNIKIDKSRLPYMVQSLGASIDRIMFITKGKNTPVSSLFVGLPLSLLTLPLLPALSLSPLAGWDLNKGLKSNIKHDLITSYDFSVSDPSLAITAEAPWGNLEELMMIVKYSF